MAECLIKGKNYCVNKIYSRHTITTTSGVVCLVAARDYHFFPNPVEYTDPDGRTGSFPDGSEDQNKQWEVIEATKSEIVHTNTTEKNNMNESIFDAVGSAFSTLSNYTGIMSDIADAENLVNGAAATLNGISVVTGVVSVVPAAYKVVKEQNTENIANLSGKAASVAAGYMGGMGSGGLAGVIVPVYVKASVAASKAEVRLDQILKHEPMSVLQYTFDYLVRYK